MAKRKYSSFQESTIEHFRRHPDELAPYLCVAFEESKKDGNWAAFMLALKMAIEANSSVADLAEKLGRSRTSLYKTLSANGNPRLDTVDAILQELGYRFTIQSVSK